MIRRLFVVAPAMASALVLTACGQDASKEETGAAAPSEGIEQAEATSGEDANAVPASFAMCKTCHKVEADQHGIGPSLAGVFGKAAGQAKGFQYSTAMLESGITWDEASLDAYIKSPQRKVSGTKMAFGGVSNDEKRAELVAYLKTL